MKTMSQFIKAIPKAELHLHIEGSLEPELMFKIAERNKIEIHYKTVEDLKKAYNFSNLQDFLDIYYEGAKVLKKAEDFYDLTLAYLKKVAAQNVIHTEIFFDPQTHTDRGISFDTVISGITQALVRGRKELNISSKLIMCFLRHLDEKAAFKTLEQALSYKHLITAVGLDSSEQGNPPVKFKTVFQKARKEGFLTVAHAGEEGPVEYVRQALNILKVSRLDHGNRAIENKSLLKELADRQIVLTMCPLSNLKLKVVNKLTMHPLKKMMNKGLMVTVNSDDPAYFGGYLYENYTAVTEALVLNRSDIYKLSKNSFSGSFLNPADKKKNIEKLDNFYRKYK